MYANEGQVSLDARRDHAHAPLASLRSRLRPGALAAVVLALPALWPLFRAGFFISDDGLFHVYRIAALAEAWHAGVLYPRLFPDFGFGYGQAVFNFYAPLAYVPGALLAALGLSPVLAAKVTVALAFLLAALAAYGLGRAIWGPLAGVVAAVTYTYFPYHLADAYVRGALPELFAFIWPPLILLAYAAAFGVLGSHPQTGARSQPPQTPPISRPGESETPVFVAGARAEAGGAGFLWGTLAWAGLVYTHNLTALMLAPFFVLYLLVLAAWVRRPRRLLPAAGSLLLAILLSAPLWLPFLVESRAVGLAFGPSAGYQKHLAPLAQAVQWLPFYRYRGGQGGGAADHPLSWLAPALVLAVLLAAGLAALRRKPLPGGPLLVFGLILAVIPAFLITAPSLPVWVVAQPVLAQLQYPWRFLTLAALGWLLLGAGMVPLFPVPLRTWAAAAVALLCLFVALPGLPARSLALSPAEAWAPDRMWAEDAANGQVGATWTGEFLPLTVSEQRWALGRALAGAKDGTPIAAQDVSIRKIGYQQVTLAITGTSALPVRLHQFYQPGWTARLEPATPQLTGPGQPVLPSEVALSPSGELGLVTASVPAGGYELSFRYGPTPARALGAGLAALGVLLWSVLAFRESRGRSKDLAHPSPDAAPVRGAGHGVLLQAAAAALLVLALALGLNRTGLGQQTTTPQPANARLEDVALLLGYQARLARDEPALDVTLYWFALRDIGEDLKAFVHLVDRGGQVVTQDDNYPGSGYTPTSRWRPGELIADRHRLPLPAGVDPDTMNLKAGMYRAGPVRNLQVQPPAADNRVDLGQVRLER